MHLIAIEVSINQSQGIAKHPITNCDAKAGYKLKKWTKFLIILIHYMPILSSILFHCNLFSVKSNNQVIDFKTQKDYMQ